MGFPPHVSRIVERLSAIAATRWGRRGMHAFRIAVPAVLLVFVAYELNRLGGAQVWAGRPHGLLFYVVLLLPFFVQPFADLAIYRNLLKVTVPLTVILRKRYMNAVMFDYSGEAYFFLWAKKNLTLKKGILIHAVKDTNVLSAGAGLVMVWLMLMALVVGGVVKLPAMLSGNLKDLIAIGSLPLVLCLALVLGGRKVTMLSRPQIAVTFAIHLARSVATLSLEFFIWVLSGALPTAGACLMYVALRLLVSRLPLIPNKDLVFVGVGLAATRWLGVSSTSASVAAVIFLLAASSLLEELAFVGLPWLIERLQFRRAHGQTVS